MIDAFFIIKLIFDILLGINCNQLLKQADVIKIEPKGYEAAPTINPATAE